MRTIESYRAGAARGWETKRASRRITQECSCCNSSFVLLPNRAPVKRCPECIRGGLTRCNSCGEKTEAQPGRTGRIRCDDCRRANRHGQERRRGERARRLTVACRGVVLFGSSRWHPKCSKIATRRGERLITQAEGQTRPSYHANDETYVCIHCRGWQRSIEADLQAIKGQVSDERIRSWATFEELRDQLRSQTTTERHARMMAIRARRPQRDPHKSRRASGPQASPPSQRRVAAVMVWRWRQGCKWELHECRICGLLLMVPAGRSTRLHGACWNDWKATDDGRSWFRRMLALRRDTDRPRRAPEPTFNQRRGRRRASEDLSRNFRWTVLVLLGGATRSLLAAEAGVHASVVEKAVRDTVQLLPDAQRADCRLRPYVELLRARAASLLTATVTATETPVHALRRPAEVGSLTLREL